MPSAPLSPLTADSITSEGLFVFCFFFCLSSTHICSCFRLVKAIIEHEAKNGIPPNRIMLGGFSQVGLQYLSIVLYSVE